MPARPVLARLAAHILRLARYANQSATPGVESLGGGQRHREERVRRAQHFETSVWIRIRTRQNGTERGTGAGTGNRERKQGMWACSVYRQRLSTHRCARGRDLGTTSSWNLLLLEQRGFEWLCIAGKRSCFSCRRFGPAGHFWLGKKQHHALRRANGDVVVKLVDAIRLAGGQDPPSTE